MGRNLVETVMGAAVLAVAAFFLFFAYVNANLSPVRGYTLTAKFNSVGALPVGSDVRIGGVKVGSVVRQRLDSEDYRAVITITIASDMKLPTDTAASVRGDGLMGGKYLHLEVGKAKTFMKPGGELKNTRDALSIEEVLGRAIFQTPTAD